MTRGANRRPAGRALVLIAVVASALAVAVPPAAAAVSGTVRTAGDPLTVRRAASTSAAAIGTVANGTTVSIDCQTTGTPVSGTYGTTTLWDYVPSLGGYVSDAYMYTGSDGQVAPDCGVGTGSAQCSTGQCAGEARFRSSDAHFVVYDRVPDGKSGVAAYWTAGGAGPFYAWNSGGSGTSAEHAVPGLEPGDWIFYKVCVADRAADPDLRACSAGLTDYVA
ncbi:uncharacterized protein YraI [Prauserella shujinwangii]|uniref:Uncharacterized protein YraI n=1 Tax=Prauserella shujinwangii TaxID=1453103 RepID=A0A2T0LYY6_9PSEU|nr:hypothetical protein [Prauserella shujinwangii]PRX49345.1 uncharacterized protein YraI [Prauserella shujinwangii]